MQPPSLWEPGYLALWRLPGFASVGLHVRVGLQGKSGLARTLDPSTPGRVARPELAIEPVDPHYVVHLSRQRSL